MNPFSQFYQYFCTHKKVTAIAMWTSFSIALVYMTVCMIFLPNSALFWLWLIPGFWALYFRIAYAKAAYDPVKDRFSDQYIPYKQRSGKKKKHKKKK